MEPAEGQEDRGLLGRSRVLPARTTVDLKGLGAGQRLGVPAVPPTRLAGRAAADTVMAVVGS